ncbi:MAG: M28 family peptidase [Candidatus Omnitrophota bacterium]
MTLLSPILRLVILTLFAFALIKLSTYGFRPSGIWPISLTADEIKTAQNLKDIVEFLAGRIGHRSFSSYENLNRSAEFIINAFEELGYQVEIVSYSVNNQLFKNIVAEDPRTDKGQGVIIIGAHYDTCYNPGADDNASGVAGLLELAQLLKGQDLDKRIRFIAFVNEEPPFFMTENMGSYVYARHIKQKNEQIELAIILESIGYYTNKKFSQRYLPLMGIFYPNRGNFVGVVGNFKSHRFTSFLTKEFKALSNIPVESVTCPSFVPGVNFSDHWSFWKENYTAVMVTDTAFLRNPNYHQPSDLPSTLNYEKISLVVHGLKRAIMNLANK